MAPTGANISSPVPDDGDEHGTIYTNPAATGEAEPVTLASRFTDLRFHARGGLGEVFRAQDSNLNRQVAVKFISPAQFDEESSRSRFILEGEITGRLDHPGVVPVYGLGETGEGRPFLAMRFIDGVTLRSAIDAYHATPNRPGAERRRDLNRLLSHLVAACNAVAYAHSRGILHRDIKPDNIMIGKFNETFVVDWGLAVPIGRVPSDKHAGEETMHLAASDASSANTFQAAGTVGYLSPESLAGGTEPVGPASDVYSLGATLYYLLTGRRSISGKATPEVLDAIHRGLFPPPRTVQPEVTRSLDAVCRKAMATTPANRHASALALAADLEACIADEPVSALRETAGERILRWARRHRSVVAAVLAGLLAVTAVSSLSGVWLAREARQEHEAREAADDAKRDSICLAATFAAQTVAGEIDVRWRILEAMADDELLRRTLHDAGSATDTTKQLQKWLSTRQQEYRDIGADSWLVLGTDGRQLSRHPFQSQTIGKDFSGRDYFHGQNREYEKPPEGVEPLRGPHVSVAYVSSSDRTLKIAYSVPIWAPDDEQHVGRPVGVLAMTARAGEFRVLKRGIGTEQVGVLVDLRTVDEPEGPRAGVVLHHPDLAARQVSRIAAAGEAGRDFLAADIIQRLERFRDMRIMALDVPVPAHPSTEEPPNFLTDYVDPLTAKADLVWFAAFEPVIVESRPAGQRETPLVVLVQQRND
jgi:serine/threonine-protein kinase